MKGGYLEDRWVQGSSDAGAFRLWRWDADVFCYFSHHLVTIPPPGWVMAARTNGAQVIGTFITEWARGRRMCEMLFSSLAVARRTAQQLASIAATHGLDGWLVNIENPLGPQEVAGLLHFLATLRAALRTLCGPNSLLMWYDAVTIEGKLSWQNHINALNQPFFDACDAIYLNYAWKHTTPAEVVERAGPRAADVYLGVDVWGRGTFGGGQDNSHVGVEAARAAGASVALFGPGWLWEAFSPQGFRERADAWWDKVGSSWAPRPAPARLLPPVAVASSFCGGFGPHGLWLNGRKVCTQPWSDIGCQSLQPRPSCAAAPASAAGVPLQGWAITCCDTTAYNGGSCVAVHGPLAALHAHGSATVRLFATALVVPAHGLEVGVAWRPSGDTGSVELDVAPTLWITDLPLRPGGEPAAAAATATVILVADGAGEAWTGRVPLPCKSTQLHDALGNLFASSVADDESQDQPGAPWRTLKLLVTPQQVPPGSVVVGLGVALRCRGTPASGLPPASTASGSERDQTEAGVLLGHLHVAEDRMHLGHGAPSTAALMIRADDVRTSCSAGQRDPCDAIDLSCDIRWDRAMDALSRPLDARFHVWARLVALPENGSSWQTAPQPAGGAFTAHPLEAAGSTPTALSAECSPSWTWLGPAHAAAFHVRIRLPTSLTEAQQRELRADVVQGSNVDRAAVLVLPWLSSGSGSVAVGVQWRVRGVSALDGLLREG